MISQQYTLEEISYHCKNDGRIMKAVLKKWFNNPKELNFVSPQLKFPFDYNQWKKLYDNFPLFSKTTLVVKHDGWIVGHVSFELKVNDLSIFHLFLELKHRGKGVTGLILSDIERRAEQSNLKNVIFHISPKNKVMINVFENLGYKKGDFKVHKMVKMTKKIQ